MNDSIQDHLAKIVRHEGYFLAVAILLHLVMMQMPWSQVSFSHNTSFV